MEAYAADATRELFLRGPTGTSNTVFRASTFEAAGGFETSMLTGQDTVLMLRLSLRGPWVHVRGVHTDYREGGGDWRSEERSLSVSFADRFRRWATFLERFLQEAATP